VPPSDPHAAEWRLRRESFANLQRHALPSSWSHPPRTLDLGAGCGWLSHRLAAIGHHAVAVDCLVDDEDGLRACRHYPVRIVAVQADFDRLPFEPAQFDLAIFNGSLHYAPDPAATIADVSRLLVPGGALAIVDSPMFVRDADGEAMAADQLSRLRQEHGLADPIRPGKGYLTFGGVERACAAAGRHAVFLRSRGVLPWRVRRQFARLKLRRAPAAFGVWVAR
jgi:SAM-dependent methyltransferase